MDDIHTVAVIHRIIDGANAMAEKVLSTCKYSGLLTFVVAVTCHCFQILLRLHNMDENVFEYEVGDYLTYPNDDGAYEPDGDDVEDDIGLEGSELEDDADNLENAISQMQGDFE